MPPPVFTQRLAIVVTTPNSWVFTGPVLAGTRWVVRTMDAVMGGTTGHVVAVAVANSPSTKAIVASFWQVVVGTTTTPWAHYEGRQVLNAGEYLATYGDAQTNVVISGYVFTL